MQAAAVLAGAILLARIVGLVQQVILNGLLPAAANDAYRAAFRLPDMVNYLVAGGAMSVTFIPIFTRLKHEGREAEAWRFFSTVATLMGAALLLLIAVCEVLAEPLVRALYHGFNAPEKAATLHLTIEMTRILLPAQIFFYLGGMIVGVLNAHRRFAASGLTGVVYNGVAIGAGLLLWRTTGASGFAWGILIGALAGNFLLPLLAARSGPGEERLRYAPDFNWRQPAVRRFFRNALPIMLGVSLPVVDQIVVGFFASGLEEGSLRNLDTGNRFMLAPLGIVAQAASVAAFPYMAADTAAEDWTRFSEFLRTGLRRLLFLALPLSTLLILLAEPLIALFRFGQFSEAAAQQTAAAFAFYCVGLFAWAGQQLVARGFYALQDTVTPTLIGSVLTVFFFVPLCWLAARSPDPILALALATSIGAAAHFCGVLLALDRRMRRKHMAAPLQTERILGTLLRTGAACLPMGIAGWLANDFAAGFFADDKVGDLMRMAAVSTVALAAFALAARLCRIPEWEWLTSKLKRR